jgi:hypothetical protein
VHACAGAGSTLFNVQRAVFALPLCMMVQLSPTSDAVPPGALHSATF